MAVSYIKSYDDTMKTLLYTKFGAVMGISSGVDTQAQKINKGVIQIPFETALRNISEKRAGDWLEFVNFYRHPGGAPAWDRQRTIVARRGISVPSVDGKSAIIVKAQPIDIQYDAWFWSRDLDKLYQVIEKYIMWQQDNPSLDLIFNDLYPLNPMLHFGEIADESTIAEEFTKGRIFIYRMPIKLDGWVLTTPDDPVGLVEKIKLTIYDKDYITDYSSIVVNDSNQDAEREGVLRMFRMALYGIRGVNLITNTITVAEDRSADFSVGNKIIIENSTGNDGTYTISEIALVAGNTNIKLVESLIDNTIDGNIYKPDPENVGA